jgi:hypothetical protein
VEGLKAARLAVDSCALALLIIGHHIPGCGNWKLEIGNWEQLIEVQRVTGKNSKFGSRVTAIGDRTEK